MPGKLVYSAITSLDGYLTDPQGAYGWSAPDEEVLAFVNTVERPVGTYLLGRRMYGESTYWETAADEPGLSPANQEFARIWLAADKIVYSRTLPAVHTARTRLEREFDPAAVRKLKAEATADLSVSGPTLAAPALAAGLVDECHLFLNPVTVGGGLPAFPRQPGLRLRLLDQHRFGSGVVHLHYAVLPPADAEPPGA
ncbi:dihydrofolate reductase family protein [Streptomyces sp. DSM 44915]|uniref:Dihydrofolate reductase family protein n=1 Tax=Streptomyces chisholmiae TaxID=3075540 RepID=A0ABU2JTB0_9ACTN|nr:dihydrofolate reductase family protein [Streptomyces sp. DSM 44915]MDT0268225.1 dihydrofolate reductase family protein [Streptomyces sp. DSM 44915]